MFSGTPAYFYTDIVRLGHLERNRHEPHMLSDSNYLRRRNLQLEHLERNRHEPHVLNGAFLLRHRYLRLGHLKRNRHEPHVLRAPISSLPDISGWNTSSVTDMSHMLSTAATSIYNLRYLQRWDTSSVTDMSYMFSGAKPTSFRRPLRLEHLKRNRHEPHVLRHAPLL